MRKLLIVALAALSQLSAAAAQSAEARLYFDMKLNRTTAICAGF